jgi:hypothetical protein
MRVANFNNKKQTKQVVGLKEVDQVIAYGPTEDYIIEEDNHNSKLWCSTQKNKKKLYRDTEKGW